jgi:hypothetical protein
MIISKSHAQFLIRTGRATYGGLVNQDGTYGVSIHTPVRVRQ